MIRRGIKDATFSRIDGIGSRTIGIGFALSSLIGEFAPGEVFPFFFTMEMFQRALLASMVVTVVSGFLGCFLLIRNLSLIGDGLAHVSFGGIAVGIVLGATAPLSYALVFSIVASIMIYELQSREILTGDASIAIFLTGMLAFGLVILRVSGGGITMDIEGYLFGNLLLIDSYDLNFITTICIISLFLLGVISQPLLAISVDPLAALDSRDSSQRNRAVVQCYHGIGRSRHGAGRGDSSCHGFVSDTSSNCSISWEKLQVLLAMDPVLWIDISVDRLVPLS